MNVKLVIDVPVHFLTGLEAALDQRKLVLRPYLKGGAQRWKLDSRRLGDDGKPAIPSDAVLVPEVLQ